MQVTLSMNWRNFENVMPVIDAPTISRQEFVLSLGKFLWQFEKLDIIADWPDDISYFCRSLITGPGGRIDTPPLWERDPPVRFRASIPTSWLSLTLTEGRNRQVRRMSAAVGFPTLRLVRWRIGPWSLEGLAPGAWRRESVNLPAQAKKATRRPAPRRLRPRL